MALEIESDIQYEQCTEKKKKKDNLSFYNPAEIIWGFKIQSEYFLLNPIRKKPPEITVQFLTALHRA